ncbi:MAG: metalloregulator ArsR/SmtB family transcription factor [Planctomycetota bacterium]
MVTHSNEPEARQGIANKEPGVFGAIADPTRRAILDGLRGGARAAGEIASGFSMSRPAVSKHLAVLERAGLVRAEKQGRRRMYALAANPLEQVDQWVARYRLHWAGRLVDLKAAAEGRGAAGGRGRA